MCLSADWTGAPPSSPPRSCFHPCHTKVLICSALTCFTGCLFAGKQAHYSFLHCHNLSFQLGIECRCVCPHWTGMLIPSNYFSLFYLCGGVCGSVPLGRASLACLGCPCFGWPVPVRFSCGFLFLVLRGSSLSLLLLGVLLWLLSFCWLPLWLGACGLARSFLFPPLPSPLGCLLVVSGPVSVLLVPPSGYLVVSATVRLSYLWYGVPWLIGSCLHSAPWQQRLRPCVGLCPLHHVVGVVHVPLAPSLRYSPSCDPVYPLDTAKAARARLLGLCCFLPPVLLPSRASALSFLAGLRLSPSPRALVLLGFVCPPCGPLSWLVLVAPPSVCFWFVLLAWPVLWFVWFRCVVRPWLVSLFCVLLFVASPHVILDRYARIF